METWPRRRLLPLSTKTWVLTSVDVEFHPVTHMVWNAVEFKGEVWAGVETWEL